MRIWLLTSEFTDEIADAANANPTNAPTGGGTASIGTVSSTGNAYADSLLKQMQELRSERDRK